MDTDNNIIDQSIQLNSSNKSRATNFEHTILDFFNRLKFDDVDGGRDNFLIGGVQVDACAGHENTLIFIECTMKQTLGKKSLRDKINEFRGKIELLEKGARKKEQYKKYKYYKYVLAVKNIDVRHEDYQYANSGDRIFILEENSLNYYEDLYSKIKQYAKYNLLGEIGIRPSQQNLIQIPASMTTLGKTRMFSFFVNPSFLLEVSYVARRELPSERYYQRIINKERLKKIAAYVNDGNFLPNNIIIAFGENVKKFVKFHELQTPVSFKQQLIAFGVSYGCLEFPKDYRSCWVIDGQHRLYSFIDVQKLVNVPVVAFQDLDIEKQCKIFLDINKFQKPVSADLVWDLNGDMIPSEADGIISNVVKILNDDHTSSMFHKIYIPSRGIRSSNKLLKMAAICLAIKRMKLASQTTHSKTRNPFYDSDAKITTRRLAKALTLYFGCLKNVLSEDMVKQEKGFSSTDGAYGVFIRIFEKIVSRLKDKMYPTEYDYLKYLNPLKQLFKDFYSTPDTLKELRLSVSSEGGKDNIATRFILFIREKTGDAYFGGEIETLGMKEIRDLEGRLKSLIKQKLKGEDDEYDWFKNKIPKDVYGILEKRLKKHNQDDYGLLYLQLTFGECINILKSNKNDFYPDFKNDDYGFPTDKAIEVAFEHISNIRNTMHGHVTGVTTKTEDDNLLRSYLIKINKCLDEVLSVDLDQEVEDDDIA